MELETFHNKVQHLFYILVSHYTHFFAKPHRLARLCSSKSTCLGFYMYVFSYMGFPGSSVVRRPLANAGDSGLIARSGTSLGEEYGNPL